MSILTLNPKDSASPIFDLIAKIQMAMKILIKGSVCLLASGALSRQVPLFSKASLLGLIINFVVSSLIHISMNYAHTF